tara:strand:+ start:171 stop:521 length:351 start_codon:yes stop_codon:yes gene_type:complete
MRIPLTIKALRTRGEPKFSSHFDGWAYSDSVTLEECQSYYWHSIAKPQIISDGVFNKAKFDGLLQLQKESIAMLFGIAPRALSPDLILQAMRAAKKKFQSPPQEDCTYLLRDLMGY